MKWIQASDGQIVNLDLSWRVVVESDVLAHVFPSLPGNPIVKVMGEEAVAELRKAMSAGQSKQPTRRGATPGGTKRIKEKVK